MQQLTTNKLFYNKYRYKIDCSVKGIGRTRSKLAPSMYKEVYDFYAISKTITNHNDVKTRSENNIHSFFFNDKELIPQIEKKVGKWIVGITSPANEEELSVLESDGPKKVMCNELPKGGFKYKMHLRPSMSKENRNKFASWAEQNYSIKYSGKTRIWLEGMTVYYPEPFIYIKDGPTLSMVLLFIGSDHRKLEEYITRSSINT